MPRRWHGFTTDGTSSYLYKKYQSKVMKFRVRAQSDAEVVLCEVPESPECYSVSLGMDENSKSVIRKKGSTVASAKTPELLNSNDFRGFWMAWELDKVLVGREGESRPFLVHKDIQPIPVGYVGVSTGNGAVGEWKVLDTSICTTDKHLNPNVDLVPDPVETDHALALVKEWGSADVDHPPIRIPNGFTTLHAKGTGDVFVTVFSGSEPWLEMLLSDRSEIRRKSDGLLVASAATPGLMKISEENHFWIRFQEGCLALGRLDSLPAIKCKDTTFPRFTHMHVATRKGTWCVDVPECDHRLDGARWVRTIIGDLPPGALRTDANQADTAREFLARTRQGPNLLPAKFLYDANQCLAMQDDKQIGVEEFEVLTNCERARWTRKTNSDLPLGSIVCGQTDKGELLFVGRVLVDNVMKTGPIYPSRNCVYVLHNGTMLRHTHCEVLTSV